MPIPVVRTTSPYMLWFDDDQKSTPAEKAERAAAYYKRKYGVAPNVVMTWKPKGHWRIEYDPHLTITESVV